jgi:hypothetical protein
LRGNYGFAVNLLFTAVNELEIGSFTSTQIIKSSCCVCVINCVNAVINSSRLIFLGVVCNTKHRIASMHLEKEIRKLYPELAARD